MTNCLKDIEKITKDIDIKVISGVGPGALNRLLKNSTKSSK